MGCLGSTSKRAKQEPIQEAEKINIAKQKTIQQKHAIIKKQVNQNEAAELAKKIREEAEKGDKFNVRTFRQKFYNLDLENIQSPYFIIMDLMKTIEILFISRGSENFLAELKLVAKLCRYLVFIFLKDKNFLTQDKQEEYKQAITIIDKISSKTKEQNFDFGLHLELTIIKKIVMNAKNERLLIEDIIKLSVQLYNIC